MARALRLQAFCSAKGGVGKSTLTVAAANLWARTGAPVVVMDLDMLGTSLADGLELVAPHVPQDANARLDLLAPPPHPWLDLVGTRKARTRRRLDRLPAHHLPYLNDAVSFAGPPEASPEPDCRVDAMCWRHRNDDGVRYLPSSALPHDVEDAIDGLFGLDDPMAWPCRLSWVIWALLQQRPDLEVLILDLPPGLLGLTDRVLYLLSHLMRGDPFPESDLFAPLVGEEFAWSATAYLVASQDWNDLQAALEYPFLYRPEKVPFLTPVLNRVTLPPHDLRRRVRQRFGAYVDIADRLKFVEYDGLALAKVFQEGALDTTEFTRSGAAGQLHTLLAISGDAP